MAFTIEFILFSTLVAATPLLLAAIGELVAERSGVLNLSVEGMMAVGAAVAFALSFSFEVYWLAIIGGGIAGIAVSLVFAGLVLGFRADQVAAGIALGILAIGVSAMIGRPFEGLAVPIMERVSIPVLSDLPILGKGIFSHNLLVYLTLLLAIAVYWFFQSSHYGLVLRAVGENPKAAKILGYNVKLVQLIAIAFGGATAGIAGGFISVAGTPLWVDGMIGGRGWIVIALIVFGTWRVERIVIGAVLFGMIENLDFLLQARGATVPPQLLTSLPYIATIIAITVMSTKSRLIRLYAPRSLGQTIN